jgi:SAM-dependent methyltransferase
MKQRRRTPPEPAQGDISPSQPRGVSYYLERLMAEVPLHRALVRAAECHLLEARELPRPILDVGAGDGTFAWALFDEPLEVGIDPDGQSLRDAQRLGAYRSLAMAAGGQLPFEDESFACVLSNSTLEHIPELEPVLAELSRVLAVGGTCVITVPSERFLDLTFGVRLFRLLRLGFLANLYKRWFNRISRHHHCDSPQVWQERLERAGLSLIEWRYYFSRASTGAMDITHYVSAPSLLTKRLLGRWVLWRSKTRLLPLARWLSPLAQAGSPETGAYLLLICRKEESA